MARQFRDVSSVKKPEKENKSHAKQLNELKRENHSLRRQLSRLRKQVGQLLDVQTAFVSDDEDAVVDNKPVEVSSDTCVSCGAAGVTKIDLPVGQFLVCKVCKHRRKNETKT